jgi:hypothetical protein
LALVLAGFAVLACGITFPLAFHAESVSYAISNFDAQFSVWNIAWVAHALGTNPLHVFDANIFYPHRWTLAYSEANLGAGILGTPVYWLTRNPYAALNFAVIATFVLSGTAMYYLAKYLSGDTRAAAISGICFAFCPHVFAHLPHIQLLMTAGLPLSLLAFHRLADEPSAARGRALGAAMAAQAYFCAYYGVFALLAIGYATLFTASWRRLWRSTAYWKAIVVGAITAILLTAPLGAVYVMIQRTTGFSRSVGDAESFAANWSAYLASSSYAHSWMLARIPAWHEVLFPGFVALLFGVGGTAVGWFSGGRARETAVLYATMGALAFWESFGPTAGLYRLTYAVVPGFTFLRAPSRFGLLVTLSLTVLASLAVRALLARVSKPLAVALAISVAAYAELFVPLNLMPVPTVAPAYEKLAALPRGAVLELPIYSEKFAYIRTRYMLGSTAHWMPLVDAYSDYIPQDFRDRADTLANFPDAASIAELRREGVRYAIVHVNDYLGELRTTLDGNLIASANDVRLLYSDDSTRLFEITAAR